MSALHNRILMLVGAFALLVPTSSAADLHFALSKSAPEDGEAVTSPAEVRLWFTEVPEDGTTSIRLIDSAGEPVSSGEVQQDAEDGRVVFIEFEHPVEAGGYTVAWRAMGSDGHVVRGDLSFSVVAR
jgi:methionine-rich copper-binding protein CopC